MTLESLVPFLRDNRDISKQSGFWICQFINCCMEARLFKEFYNEGSWHSGKTNL
jgi:hypothetical protein